MNKKSRIIMNIKKPRLLLMLLIGIMLLNTPADARFLFFGRKKTDKEKQVDAQIKNSRARTRPRGQMQSRISRNWAARTPKDICWRNWAARRIPRSGPR